MKRGLLNKRYRQTEEAILEVLLDSKEMPSVGELTKRARISRSTLYRHHRAIPGIVPDYEKEILIRYRKMIRKILKQKEISLKNVYLKTLFFVLRHKRVFEILFRYEGDRVVERMVLEVKDLIIKACHLPKNSEKMIKIYAKEIAGMVEMWGERGFNEDEMNKLLDDMMFLTREMRGRLRILVD